VLLHLHGTSGSWRIEAKQKLEQPFLPQCFMIARCVVVLYLSINLFGFCLLSNTGVTGFEYWSPNHWGSNDSPPQLRGGWVPNTFLKYNGDGYLTYPSGDKRPLSSLRLANLRDGFEDYEYLYLLDELEQDNDLAKQVVTGPMKYSSDPEVLYKTRALIAKRIEQLKGNN